MVKFSAFADEVTDDLAGQVEFLVSQNIRNIEVRFLNQKNIMDLEKRELLEAKKMLDDNGISVSAIGSPIGKIKLDQPFEVHLDKFKHAIELAVFFEAPLIRIFSYYAPDGKCIDDFREEVLNRMAVKAELMKGSNVILVHENESHIYGHIAEHCADIAGSVNSPGLKLAYDPGNFVWGNNITGSMVQCWRVMEPYVEHVHIKDWKSGSADTGSLPGEGDGGIKALLKRLSEIHYHGFLTMEPHLVSGGRFSGKTSPELFKRAIKATREICDQVNLEYC
ncbi:MAG TPA: sugar phosphate isomerase/epimerase family protein [Chitinophagaceae bacterium]